MHTSTPSSDVTVPSCPLVRSCGWTQSELPAESRSQTVFCIWKYLRCGTTKPITNWTLSTFFYHHCGLLSARANDAAVAASCCCECSDEHNFGPAQPPQMQCSLGHVCSAVAGGQDVEVDLSTEIIKQHFQVSCHNAGLGGVALAMHHCAAAASKRPRGRSMQSAEYFDEPFSFCAQQCKFVRTLLPPTTHLLFLLLPRRVPATLRWIPVGKILRAHHRCSPCSCTASCIAAIAMRAWHHCSPSTKDRTRTSVWTSPFVYASKWQLHLQQQQQLRALRRPAAATVNA